MDVLITSAAKDKKPKGQHSNAVARQSHIKKWKESSLSMSEYCRQQGLSVSSLSSWVKKYNKPKALFKPLVSAPISKEQLIRTNVIEVLFGQQIKIRFLNVTDPLMIINIVKELSNAVNN